MRARVLAALMLATMAATGVFESRLRGQGPPPQPGPVRRPGSTEWLADAHARTTAAESAAFVVEMVLEVPGHDPVVFRESGAFDAPRRRRWWTVEVAHADTSVPPIRVLVLDDDVWVSPGHAAGPLGLRAGDWLRSSLPMLERFGQHRWRDGLSGTGRLVRDLVPRSLGDSMLIGEDAIRSVSTTHARPWVEDPGLGDAAAGGPLDVWVDDQSRLRKVQFVAAAPHRPSRVTFRLELFDYGQPVKVNAPDPAEVIVDDALAAQIVAQLPMGSR